MARLGPEAVVAPPQAVPPLHNLIATAQQVPEAEDRWEAGFIYRPESCACAQAWAFDCDPDGTLDKPAKPTPEAPVGFIEYEPFQLVGSFECGPVGYSESEYEAKARRQLETTSHCPLEDEFWTGGLRPANPHLTMPGSVIVNPFADPLVPLSPARALCLIQAELAQCCPGGRSTIHAPVCVASLWATDEAIFEDRDGRLRTKVRGDWVVAGGCYPGSGPEGHAQEDPDPGSVWVFATSGVVHVRLGAIHAVPQAMSEALDRRTNVVTWRAERTAAATWDNCCLVAALVSTT